MTPSEVAKVADLEARASASADRLRKFRRTLTGWRVTNSDDSDLKGALGDAIDALEAVRDYLRRSQ